MSLAEAILLIEDEEDLRQNLAYILQHKGFRVVTARNGQEALQVLSTEGPPCLIILDLMMPVMDGWTFRAELLKDPALSDIPVVLLSGIADLQAQAKTLRAVDYLTKPVDLDKLYALVSSHC